MVHNSFNELNIYKQATERPTHTALSADVSRRENGVQENSESSQSTELWNIRSQRLFIPKTIRSHGGTFVLGSEWTLDLSFFGPFVHWNISFLIIKKLWNYIVFSAVPGLALPSWERIVLGTNVPDTNLPTLGIRLYSYAPYLQEMTRTRCRPVFDHRVKCRCCVSYVAVCAHERMKKKNSFITNTHNMCICDK